MSISEKVITKAFGIMTAQHKHNKSKSNLESLKNKFLLDIGHISNQASQDKYNDKQLQKAFFKASVDATVVGLITNNRFFEECLTMTYMNAYGSTDIHAPHNSIQINDNDDEFSRNMLSKQGQIQVKKRIPKSTWFYVEQNHHFRKLTNHDVAESLHHGLYSLKHDSMITM